MMFDPSKYTRRKAASLISEARERIDPNDVRRFTVPDKYLNWEHVNHYTNLIYVYSNVFRTLKKSYDRFHILSMAVKVDLEPVARHELRLSKQQCHHQVLKCLSHKI